MDPFTTTLGILTAISMVTGSVVTFAKAIEGLRAHYKTVQDLWDELIALETVLHSLNKACESDPTQFSLLVFPLERCGQACGEFSLVIKKCIVHSDGSRPSVRDWAMLKYMGNDISGFLRMLDGYKMTICIALETITIRGSQISIEYIQSYQKKISANVTALEDRLNELNTMLESLASERQQNVASGTVERTQMLEEKASIQRLIEICLGASQDLENRQTDIENTENKLNEPERLHSAKQATIRSLQICQKELANTSNEIQAEIQISDNRTSSIEWAAPDINTEQQRLERELESVRRQLAICKESNRFAEEKRQMIFERVSAGNQASQTIASNCKSSIIARDIKIGDGTFQALGQFDDVTIQHMSQNHTALLAPQVVSSKITLEATVHSCSQEEMTPQCESSDLPSRSTSDTSSLKGNIINNKVKCQNQKHHGIRFKTLSFVKGWDFVSKKQEGKYRTKDRAYPGNGED